jgi:nicotinamide mononucleotide (NMN) deamidase PncC
MHKNSNASGVYMNSIVHYSITTKHKYMNLNQNTHILVLIEKDFVSRGDSEQE